MISEFDYCAPLDRCSVCGTTIFRRGDALCAWCRQERATDDDDDGPFGASGMEPEENSGRAASATGQRACSAP
jgi:uncharacterized Zn finger protein (UPF0148 family)